MGKYYFLFMMIKLHLNMWHANFLLCLGDFAGPKYVVPVESGLGKEKALEIFIPFC